MITIVVEDKTYDLARRMTTYEIRQTAKMAAKYADLDKRIEDNTEEAQKVIMSTNQEEETLMDEIIANCLGWNKEEVPKKLEFIHELLLFGEILRSSVPEKNLSLRSEKPTIGTMSIE